MLCSIGVRNTIARHSVSRCLKGHRILSENVLSRCLVNNIPNKQHFSISSHHKHQHSIDPAKLKPIPAQIEKKPFYVTTPIFYVNAVPHVGHLQSIVLADVLARWYQWRNLGWSSKDIMESNEDLAESNVVPSLPPKEWGSTNVILATGTDEHGSKIQKAAEKLGESPRQLCDRVSERFLNLADAAGIGYTRFIRTTDEDHIKTVKVLWDQLLNSGFIYKGSHSGWYSVVDEAFYTEAQVTKATVDDAETMISIETGNVVEWTEEENYKFRLSLFEGPIQAWLKEHSSRIVPDSRYQATLQELSEGLQDLSISRPKSRLQWGIEVPNDSEQTMYVWFDALLNYVTVSGYPWNGAKPGSKDVLGSWPADMLLVGKDIIRFHAIYFPAFLMALGLPLPRQIVTHGHWTVNKSKMSKSKGNAVDPFVALNSIGVDELRFYLTRLGGNLGKDQNWNDAALQEFVKKHLSSQYGNLLSRVLSPSIINKLIPEGQDEITLSAPTVFEQVDEEHLAILRSIVERVDGNMSRLEISHALESILEMLESSQKHFHHLQPWSIDPKEEVQGESKLWRAIYISMESCRIAALLSQAVMPKKMDEMLTLLNIPKEGRTFENAKTLRQQITLGRIKQKIKPLFQQQQVGKIEENKQAKL